MTNNKTIPCFVDALSFTWLPDELLRIKQMAKIGATLKSSAIAKARNNSFKRFNKKAPFSQAASKITREYDNRRHKDLPEETIRLYECEVAARYELRDILSAEYDLTVDTSKKYDDRLSNLLDNIGIDTLDCLLCGEAEKFVCRLNNVFTEQTYIWTIKHNDNGRFNYTYSANLYADGEQAGVICWGGKNLGVYVSFMGVGCNAIDLHRLYQELKKIPSIKITRIDLAYDDFDGKHSIAVARKYAKKGGFDSGGRPSRYMYIESGSLSKKGHIDTDHFRCATDSKSTAKRSYRFIPHYGKSLYIGSRESGKLLRIYEKGKQLGDKKSKWVRWELELHSSQRVIPLDAMIEPAKYLAGAYPCLSFLNQEQCRIKTVVKKTRLTVQRIVENHVTNTRKAINMMRELLGMSDAEIIDRFLRDLQNPLSKHAFPSRLNIDVFEKDLLTT